MIAQAISSPRGLVYTFYSFKGGVGRSMAVANIAALLARWGKRVLVLDWDLEAPGIEKYFAQYLPPGRGRRDTPGLIELLGEVMRGREPRWRDHLLRATLPGRRSIDIISAGRDDAGYISRLQDIDWDDLFARHGFGDVLERMRTDWIGEYDFVLVDSRTGITDIGGICTIHLPDVIIALFTANQQSLEGVNDVMQRARRAHQALPVDRNRLLVVPVPARDESDREYKLAEEWRARFAAELGELFDDWAPHDQRTEDILNRVKLPYFSYWSFGERLPVLEEDPENPRTLAGAFAFLAKLMIGRLDWDKALHFGKPAVRFDYRSERERHGYFVGRASLLTRLDELLLESDTDRWVAVIGGPGMGKSALLAAWLTRREAAGATVPHHFIRRGEYDWDDPAKLVASLVAQLEDSFPQVGGLDVGERMHPATRLTQALSRVSEQVLCPRGERLVVLIDGLDEYDPPAGRSGDPLAAFLPNSLPPGVRMLCASRPRHPYVSSLMARDGAIVAIDLDDVTNAADNDATIHAFWDAAAKTLRLDVDFIAEAVACAHGNIQHAVQLRKHVEAQAAEQRRVEAIPRGLAALLASVWERIATDTVVVEGLGILCAAREALTLDEVSTVAGWSGEAQRRAFVRGARELLIESQRVDKESEYRLHHDSIRGQIIDAIGAVTLRGHHHALAQKLATWPPRREASARRYALRHALQHRVEAETWTDAWRLASDMTYLEAKCREVGAQDVEADVSRTAERCRKGGDETLCKRFEDLARALGRESHWLRAAPEATGALVWNRLRQSGWSSEELDQELQLSTGAAFLRVRHVATRESPALERTLIGHTSPVRACAVTPDGRHVVSASADRTLKVWELATGALISTLEGHASWVTACSVTPDGRYAVSASDDRSLKVWELGSGTLVATLEGHSAAVTACAVTPDGSRVVSASDDRTLKVWELETGALVTTLEGHSAAVTACAVTPDGSRAVSASDDRTLKVWELETGALVTTLEGHAFGVTACAVTLDGRRVVSASEDGTLKVWELGTSRLVATLEGHVEGVTSCAVTPDGRRVVSASKDRTLKVWEMGTGALVATLEGHAAWVNACSVTPDGWRVVSASGDGTLMVWELATGALAEAPEGHLSWVTACAITPDGRRVVSASNDRILRVWELGTGERVATLEGHAFGVTACAITPDGRRVVSASDDRTLKVWELETGALVATLEGHASGVNACAVTPDGRRVVSASDDRTLKVWDAVTGTLVATLEGHTSRVLACAVTPDGRHMVSASYDRTLKVWDLGNYELLATLGAHVDSVRACAVTPDGRRVVSASDDGTLRVWEIGTWALVATLGGHASVVRACAVMPDGRRMVSISDDRTLKVWDLPSGGCLLTHHTSAAFTAFVTTTAAIVAGDAAGAIWFLDLPSPARQRPNADERPPSDYDRLLGPPRKIETAPHSTPVKHTVLFLAANPLGTDRLALDVEARAIQLELERNGFRDSFAFETRWAMEPLDLLRELRKVKPSVVHFSGHPTFEGADAPRVAAGLRSAGVVRDSPAGAPRQGLYFQSPDSQPQVVSAEVLSQVFAAAGGDVKLVMLSACYSDQYAAALVTLVDCVVGTRGSIREDLARSFAIGFYGGMCKSDSVAVAYEQGCAAIHLKGVSHTDRPQLKVRQGVDAAQLILASTPQASLSSAGAAAELRPGYRGGAPASAPNVDIGILTIREDEFRAVLAAFPDKAGMHMGTNRGYTLRYARVDGNRHYRIAMLRLIEQGNGEAQDAARDLIDDLAPRLVLVVGIASATPSDDVKLGDVVVSTRIHDFTVEARKAGHQPAYSVTGGPIDKGLAAFVTHLAAREDELANWATGLPAPPPMIWETEGQLYGPPDWQHELRDKLANHLHASAAVSTPTYMIGAIAASDRLVKDPELLIPWLRTAHDLRAIEMDSAGVYRAVRGRCPMLAIRGISDIVGMKRSEAWTKYACASAAAFARAFLRTHPVGQPDNTAAAELAFKRGEAAMKRDQPGEAILEFKAACDLNPNDVDYAGMLAWAKFCAAGDKVGIGADTRKALERAVFKSQRPERARFYLGRVELMLGRDKEALRHFQGVLDLKPNHADAASEIRAIEARTAAAIKSGSSADRKR